MVQSPEDERRSPVEVQWLVDSAIVNAQPGQLGFLVSIGPPERPDVRLLDRPALDANGLPRLRGDLDREAVGGRRALGVGRVVAAVDQRSGASSPCSMTIGAELEVLAPGSVDEAEALAALGHADLAAAGAVEPQPRPRSPASSTRTSTAS